jgi:peptidyl-prolyl cis-trans isomerase D
MLEKIRRIAHHYLFKLFFLLLAVVFVISLRDFSGSSTTEVASVGGQKISVQDFIQAKQEVMNQFKDQELLPEQINNIAVMRLTTQALLQQEALSLGITVSPEVLAEYIRNDSNFHKNGEFDLEVYKKLLQHNNLSEDKLLKSLSNQVASKFIVDSLSVNMPLTKVLNDYLYDYLTEKRVISLISANTNKLSFSNLNEVELKDYYQKNQNLFQSREKRSFSYILLSPGEFGKNAVITEADLYKDYENNMAEYALPETRDFYHFLSPSQELGDKVVQSLKANSNVQAVAKDFVEQKVISENFTNQPSTSFVSSLDPSLFELKEGEVSAVIKSDLGWHVFKITKIHPKQYKSFAESRVEAEKQLRNKMAEKQLYDISKQIEDDVASGASLQDIAKRHNLPFSQVSQASGNEAVTVVAFQTELNEESDITPIHNNQDYVIVKVNEVIPAKTLDYVEVTDKLKDLYALKLKGDIASEVAKAMQESYQKDPQALVKNSALNSAVVQNILKPISIKYKVSSGDIVTTLTSLEVARPILVSNPNLPPAFVDGLFNLKVGKASTVQALDTAKYGFSVVMNIVTGLKKDPQLYKYVESISSANYKNDIYDQYLDYLRSKYLVEINYELIKNKS